MHNLSFWVEKGNSIVAHNEVDGECDETEKNASEPTSTTCDCS
jgi:hypothetical protein